MKERGFCEKIYYTHLSRARREQRAKDKPVIMLRNCRQYLDFMENYILDVVKQNNQDNMQRSTKNTERSDEEERRD